MAGLELDEWQADVLRGAMSTRADGKWAAFRAAVLVSRQNGKGSILEARQLAGLFVLGERLQVHTAHEFKTCYEHFRRVKDLVENTPVLARQVSIIRTGAGDQAIELKTGARIRFIARSRSSGRGFSGDTIYLDEAFKLDDETLGALLPALSARPNPQVWFTSSAPHAESEVLHRIRRDGHAGSDPRLFFAEWAADPNDDFGDPDVWFRTNPSLGIRLDPELVAAEHTAMSTAEFARERLGIPEGVDDGGGPIGLTAWDALTDPDSRIVGPPCFALDVSPERTWATICAAGRRPDGLVHVEHVRRDVGTAWVPAFAEELHRKWEQPIALDPASPAGSLIVDLQARGVPVVEIGHREHAQAAGALLDAITSGTLRHIGQVTLRDAVAAGRKRQTGDVWLWSRSTSSADITPLVAMTLAYGRARTPSSSEPWVMFA